MRPAPTGTAYVVGINLRGGNPTVDRWVAAPADVVWRILVGLPYWPRWGPTVTGANTDGDVPLDLGVTGRVYTPVGIPLPFVVTEYVPGRSWAWRVAGIPATRHGVDPDGDGCRVWMSAPLWAAGYVPVLAIALPRIDALASEAGLASPGQAE